MRLYRLPVSRWRMMSAMRCLKSTVDSIGLSLRFMDADRATLEVRVRWRHMPAMALILEHVRLFEWTQEPSQMRGDVFGL
jgi:hypothetical protein